MLDKLPERFLIDVCSSSLLEVGDRLNLMLTCKRLNAVVSKCWGRVRRLRIANNESDDDRISDRFITSCILKSTSSLTSITLCLNSSINSQLCKGITLFEGTSVRVACAFSWADRSRYSNRQRSCGIFGWYSEGEITVGMTSYLFDEHAPNLYAINICGDKIRRHLCVEKWRSFFMVETWNDATAKHLRSCVALRELTLLLTQLSQRCLYLGLCRLTCLSLRKLALVNSVADASTMRVISNTQSSTLRSLGLINCFYLGDDALDLIIGNVQLRTLNIRSSRRVTTAAIQRLIDAHRSSAVKEPLKLYLFRSSVDIPSLKYELGRVLFFDEKCWRKRLRTGEFLHETAVRPDWEYSSDEDDFV